MGRITLRINLLCEIKMLHSFTPFMSLPRCQWFWSKILAKCHCAPAISFWGYTYRVIILVDRPNDSFKWCLVNSWSSLSALNWLKIGFIISLGILLLSNSKKIRIPRLSWYCIEGWEFLFPSISFNIDSNLARSINPLSLIFW